MLIRNNCSVCYLLPGQLAVFGVWDTCEPSLELEAQKVKRRQIPPFSSSLSVSFGCIFHWFWTRKYFHCTAETNSTLNSNYPTPVLLPGKSRGWQSMVGCSPWGRWQSDMTERLPFHFSLSCIGEGNGNPLQCSCLENPRERGAWWASTYGVAQSRTRLKRLSSSSSMRVC